MSQLKITLVQYDIFWENITANLAELEEKFWQVETGNIIVLPEMFNTGFSMNAEKLAEPMNFTTFRWLKQQAEQHKALIIGSLIIKENKQFYNRAIWMYPDGQYGIYDKTKPFRMMEEDQYFTPGKNPTIFSHKGWNIKPIICYDLRFPETSRNHFNKEKSTIDYDLLICMGNWPTARIHAWNTLLQARAMENSCYVAAVNRVGADGNGVEFGGCSNIVDPRGKYLIDYSDDPFIQTIEIDFSDLQKYRNNFQMHLDW
mgnify:CR=1 FL=1